MLAHVAGKRSFSRLVFTAVVALVTLARIAAAVAQVGSANYSSIVIDAASGNVLSAANSDELRFPASLTKMMTLYLVFEALRDRRVVLNQFVPVSPSASGMEPTKLGLMPGSLITVEQCVLGLVTKSANDAAAALGEMLGGDEDRFAQMMTLRARALGMANTTFRNASGLPDWNQVTTARDMAVLARHLIQDFPGFYHYFSERSFVYAGRRIWNHQAMLSAYPGADGLKTGFTNASGFNVVTSALRNDTRLIGVVLGAASSGERNAHMMSLMDQGFDRMGVPPVYMARREPQFRIPAIISVAQAQPRIVAAPPEHPRATRAALPARRSETRPERFVTYAAVRPAPRPVFVVPPRPAGPTRTAHGGGYRYPG